jgi:hypothetical protein
MSNTTKRLLTEYFPLQFNRQDLNEAVKGNGTFSIRAILQRANSKNQNGRVYPKEILMREASKYAQEFVKNRRSLGELDHPDSRTVVNLANVSHLISEIHWEGDDLVGNLEILSTPNGNIVKELLRNGVQLGVSSRGIGSVSQIGEGTDKVEDDYNLVCFDIVSNPSTQGAFLGESVNHSLQENKAARINGLITDFFTEIGKKS